MAGSTISHARRCVEGLRIALLSPSPQEMAACLPALEQAVQDLSSLQQELSAGTGGSAGLRSEVAALARELRVVTRLADHGAALNLGWARLLGGMVAGYLPTGEPAPLTRALPGAQSISLQG